MSNSFAHMSSSPWIIEWILYLNIFCLMEVNKCIITLSFINIYLVLRVSVCKLRHTGLLPIQQLPVFLIAACGVTLANSCSRKVSWSWSPSCSTPIISEITAMGTMQALGLETKATLHKTLKNPIGKTERASKHASDRRTLSTSVWPN